jgi:hypothetical protein
LVFFQTGLNKADLCFDNCCDSTQKVDESTKDCCDSDTNPDSHHHSHEKEHHPKDKGIFSFKHNTDVRKEDSCDHKHKASFDCKLRVDECCDDEQKVDANLNVCKEDCCDSKKKADMFFLVGMMMGIRVRVRITAVLRALINLLCGITAIVKAQISLVQPSLKEDQKK